jgi:hypothetical protein
LFTPHRRPMDFMGPAWAEWLLTPYLHTSSGSI